jgi:acetate kinase
VIDLTPKEVATGDRNSELFQRVVAAEEERREAVLMVTKLEHDVWQQDQELKQKDEMLQQLSKELQQQSQKLKQQSEELQQLGARIVELEQDGHVKKRTKT